MVGEAAMAAGPAATRFSVRRAPAARRWRAVSFSATWLGFAVVVLLGALAPVMRTGDAHQYYAMAFNLAAGEPPALTAPQVAAYKTWLAAQPPASGFATGAHAVDQPPLLVDGRQEFSHFWLYPLLAAPGVRLATWLGAAPGFTFLAVNVALLGLALWQVGRVYTAVVSLFLLATPIVWFINKAQVEVFTFALLGIAMAQAARGRWLWAAFAAALAASQNVPILAAVLCFWGAGILTASQARPRPRPTATGTLLVLATLVVGLAHPLYYWWRLGVVTPQQLNGGIAFRPPGIERYLAVLIDPDLGLLAWLPLHAALAVLGCGLIWWWPRRHRSRRSLTLGSPLNGAAVATAATATAANRRVGDARTRSGAQPDEARSEPNPNPRVIDSLHDRESAFLVGDAAAGSHPIQSCAMDAWATRRLAGLCGLIIGGWFLVVFAQTTNVNSGGTVHLSRYALWLVPLGLPFLATAAAWLGGYLPGLLPVVGGMALAAYLVLFRPAQAERYVVPSPQAATLAAWLPVLYRPVPEIFYERQRHQDGGVRGSAALTSCRLILLDADDRGQPCPLTPTETAAADALLAADWQAVWIARPGILPLGGNDVRGAVRRP